MTSATFPGNSNYRADLIGWRDGNRVYGRLTVTKLRGSGYWTASGQAYRGYVNYQEDSGTWTYDFRNQTTITVWEGWRDVPGPGSYPIDGWAEMAGLGRAQPAQVIVTVPPAAPVAPTVPTLARTSDTEQTVSWQRRASAAAPYSTQQVQRRTHNASWQAWTGVASFGTASNVGNHSWIDKGTVANRAYQYRVKATNSAGEAYSPDSLTLYTSPGVPSAVVAAKQATGSIKVDITQTVSHTAYQTGLEYSTNGGATWAALATLNAGVNSYTWNSPPAVASILIRARVVVVHSGAIGNGLASAWKNSNVVAGTVAPNAPSALSPNGVAKDVVLEPVVFSWQHNPGDTSGQTAYELRYRTSTGAWVSTGKVDSTASSRVVPEDTLINGNAYQWEVRTWGAHADASPWSPTASFTSSAAPQVSITSPGAVLPSAKVVVTWSYSDSEGTAQSGWNAELIHEDAILESLSGNGSVTSAAFTTRLKDAEQYQVQVRVRDGSSIWSEWDQQSFLTDFPSPAVPTLDAVWNDDFGKAMLSVSNPESSPPADSNEVFRSIDGGTIWESVGTAPVNGTVFDSLAPLGFGDILYRVVAWSSLPSFSVSPTVAVSPGTKAGYWSVGADYGYTIPIRMGLRSAPKVDISVGVLSRSLNYYAGRRLPVETVGEAVMRTGSAEFLINSVDQKEMAVQMSQMKAPHLIRMPDQTFIQCSIGTVSIARVDEGWYTVKFSITEVSL